MPKIKLEINSTLKCTRRYDAFYPSYTPKAQPQDIRSQMLYYKCVWEMQKMKEKCRTLELQNVSGKQDTIQDTWLH